MDAGRLFRGLPDSLQYQVTDLVNRYSGVISGSFILRYFFPDFPFGDIDVFLPIANQSTEIEREYVPTLLNWGWQQLPEAEHNDYDDAVVTRVSEWRVEQVKVNIIHVESKSRQALVQHIRARFDFDGCTGVFDGNVVVSPQMNATDFANGRWRIQELEQSWAQACVRSRSADALRKLLLRIQKYQARGIAFLNLAFFMRAYRKTLGEGPYPN